MRPMKHIGDAGAKEGKRSKGGLTDCTDLKRSASQAYCTADAMRERNHGHVALPIIVHLSPQLKKIMPTSCFGRRSLLLTSSKRSEQVLSECLLNDKVFSECLLNTRIRTHTHAFGTRASSHSSIVR